jgi:molybdate transport system substrate-binding protein
MQKFIKGNVVLFLVLSAILFFSGCSTEQKTALNGSSTTQSSAKPIELTISAAASLTDALKEIQKIYESNHKAIKLHYNFGASGALQQQIEQGAPADLFLSAAPKNMKALVDKQLIEPTKQKTLLTNELVVVIPADGKIAIGSPADLIKTEVKLVAIGIPESVPAGSYAKEALTNANLWESLQAKTVQGKDVRQVLQYVETGNADAGFVYKTDALTSQKVKIAFALDSKTYTPVEYPIGIVKSSKHSNEAEDFYEYLQSKEALDIFVKHGFSRPK